MEMMRKSALLPIGLGRPIALALVDQVRICLMYLRTNITQEFLAEMFFISQPTVSRIISTVTVGVTVGWLAGIHTHIRDGMTLVFPGAAQPVVH